MERELVLVLLFLPNVFVKPFPGVLITPGPCPNSLSHILGTPLGIGRCSKLCLEPCLLWARQPVEWAGEVGVWDWSHWEVQVNRMFPAALGAGLALPSENTNPLQPWRGVRTKKGILSGGGETVWEKVMQECCEWMLNRSAILNLGLIYVGLTVKPLEREKWCVKLLLRHLSSELCLGNCFSPWLKNHLQIEGHLCTGCRRLYPSSARLESFLEV